MNELRRTIWRHRWHLFRRLWLPSGLFAGYCLVVITFEDAVLGEDLALGGMLHAVVAFLLGAMLSFRTNTAYDRWWEARKLWGQLVNRCRGFALKVRTLAGLALPERQEVARLVAGFAFAMRDHLRSGAAALREIPGFADEAADPRHVPVHLSLRLYDRLRSWRASGRLDGFAFEALDREAAQLMDVLGGCERIRNTPLVHSHRVSIHHLIVVYLLVLPWTLENELWAPALAFLAAGFVLGVELIADDIEDPFGTELDDLPLDGICLGIERVVREILVDEVSDLEPAAPAPGA